MSILPSKDILTTRVPMLVVYVLLTKLIKTWFYQKFGD